MKISEIEDYDDLLEYLRTFKNWRDEEHIYDFNAVVYLLLASLDNLQAHALDAKLDDIGYSFTDTQRQFIARIAEYANRITDEMIDKESD